MGGHTTKLEVFVWRGLFDEYEESRVVLPILSEVGCSVINIESTLASVSFSTLIV